MDITITLNESPMDTLWLPLYSTEVWAIASKRWIPTEENPMTLPAIVLVNERDVCRQNEQTIEVVTRNDDESEFDFDTRVEATATRMAARFGADAYIYGPNSVARIPVVIEEIA